MMGCGDMPRPAPDAAVQIVEEPAEPGCPERPTVEEFNFFGEACASDPDPINTLCRNYAGWCVANVCRPQCAIGGTSCFACPPGTVHYAPAGACYCAPS